MRQGHLPVGVLEQVVCGCVHAQHAVPAREVLSFDAIPAHHRKQRRAVGVLKRGAALDLGDVAAADHPPANGVHGATW